MIFDCFKKEQDRGAPAPVQPPIVLPTNNDIDAYVFFVGHQDAFYGTDYGTRTYNKIKEQPANRLLAEGIIEKVGATAKVHMVLRKEDRSDYDEYLKFCKKELKIICEVGGYDIKKVVCVELHYNAASVPEARGVEAIISDHRSALFAYPIVQSWSSQFNIVPRRKYNYTEEGVYTELRGIYFKRSGNGSGWTKTISGLGAIAILWEGFFCDFKNEETEQFFGDGEEYFINIGLPKMVDFWAEKTWK